MVGPIGRLPYDFICKVQEKALGITSQSLSMQWWVGEANTGQNKGRQPEGSYSIIGGLLLILQLTQCFSPRLPIGPAGEWGLWLVGKSKAKASFKLPDLSLYPVCAWTVLFCPHNSLLRGVTAWRDETCFLMVSLILQCQVTHASLPCPPHGFGRYSTNICCLRPAPYEFCLHQMTGPVG